MTHSLAISCVFALSIASSGCSSGVVNIGEKPDASARTGLDAFVGNWQGYIEAYTFMDDSDTVRLTITDDGAGSIRFGNTAPFAPPTNASDTYPPNFPPTAGLPQGTDMPNPWTGFAYELNGVRVHETDTGRLTANAISTELFAPWCKLQTSYLVDAHADADENVYACVPCDFGLLPTTETNQQGEATVACRSYTLCATDGFLTGLTSAEIPTAPISCAQEALCANGSYSAGVRTGVVSDAICVCDANGCALAAQTPDMFLDVTLTDNQSTLTGALVFGDTNRTLWLRRQ